jgi:hypothetical protein
MNITRTFAAFALVMILLFGLRTSESFVNDGTPIDLGTISIVHAESPVQEMYELRTLDFTMDRCEELSSFTLRVDEVDIPNARYHVVCEEGMAVVVFTEPLELVREPETTSLYGFAS